MRIMKLAVAAFTLVLTSCTFHSSQLNTLRGLLSFKEPAQAQYLWRAQFGRTDVGVVALDREGLIVFAGSQGDAIAFDGWMIRSVVGLGLTSTLIINSDGQERLYQEGLGAAQVHSCSDWAYHNAPLAKWVQQCESEFYYKNEITLDDVGRIVKIDQVVSADGTRLILTKQQQE